MSSLLELKVYGCVPGNVLGSTRSERILEVISSLAYILMSFQCDGHSYYCRRGVHIADFGRVRVRIKLYAMPLEHAVMPTSEMRSPLVVAITVITGDDH